MISDLDILARVYEIILAWTDNENAHRSVGSGADGREMKRSVIPSQDILPERVAKEEGECSDTNELKP